MITHLFMAIAVSFWSLPPVIEEMELPKRSREVLQNIRKESNNTLSVKWNEATGTPEVISGTLTKPSLHSPGWISYDYLHKIKELYGIKRVNEDLKIVHIDKSENMIKVYLQRQLFKKPVYGERMIVEIDPNGSILRIEGVLHPELEKKRLGRPMYPAVTLDEAKKAAFESDDSMRVSKSLYTESCYLPDREGVPLVYVFHYEKNGRPASIKVHALTGRVI
ncbi:hypothetical protein [Paenibacillus thalictri]|uniref:FTP domain-containing protein n=1 Tax=Paenibacillus thalictri TaxID=2527873 RepID=A0A4V2J4M5_9BACL|nr:hypothetical protein [Paenibacillus thalictri]TBL80411.1 hypothetical protein EYB31_08325 [Paenibacillus thalictri]